MKLKIHETKNKEESHRLSVMWPISKKPRGSFQKKTENKIY